MQLGSSSPDLHMFLHFFGHLGLSNTPKAAGKLPLVIECISRDFRDHLATITDVSVVFLTKTILIPPPIETNNPAGGQGC